MVKFFDNLPTVRTVIVSVFWLQVISAAFVFWVSHKNLLETRFGTRYITEEVEIPPPTKPKLKYQRKVAPTLKKNPNYKPSLDLPSQMPNSIEFQDVFIEGLGNGILLSGEITEGAHLRFNGYLTENKLLNISFVALNSPGGLVYEALLIGREIRERGIKTVLSSSAICLSACPYIMMGGVDRIISSYSLLGVHQHYFTENLAIPVYFAVESVQAGQAEVFRHLKEMDISTDVMEYILSTPPEEMYIFRETELEEYNLATEIIPISKR